MCGAPLNDGVQPVIGHDLQHVNHQCVARLQIGMLPLDRIICGPAPVCTVRHHLKQRRGHGSASRSERRVSTLEVKLEHRIVFFDAAGPRGEQRLEVRNDDGIDDFRTGLAEISDRPVKHVFNFLEIAAVGLGGVSHGLAQNADTCAF
jgi:hypothetical protein